MTTTYPTEIRVNNGAKDDKIYTVSLPVHGGVPSALVLLTLTSPTGAVYRMKQRSAGENFFLVEGAGRKVPFAGAHVDGERWVTHNFNGSAHTLNGKSRIR